MVAFHMLATAKSGRDIELPAEVCHRSVENTLILVPGHSYEVTQMEWDFIARDHSDLTPDLRKLRADQ